MSQPPGQLVGDMVWLVARYPRKPGVLMKMGSILTDPADLETSLNLESIEAPPNAMDASLGVRTSVKTSLSHDNSALLKAAAAVPVLSGVAAGAGVEGRWRHDVATTVNALNVRASEFIPDEDYMNRALQNPKVVAFAKGCLFFERLYVVVGVATARELHIKEDTTQQRTVKASVSAKGPGVIDVEAEAKQDTTAAASSELHIKEDTTQQRTVKASVSAKGPGVIDVEAEAKQDTTAAASLGLEVGEECDFAYRVRQFTYYKVRGLRNKGNYTEKAMFGADRGANRKVEEPDYVPAFGDLEPKDAAPAGLVSLGADA